jgi:rfaE bifunctional protein nucleotidyltransferase chain/domain
VADPSRELISTAYKIRSRGELGTKRDRLAQASRTVVLTNGCFDILHVGHVRYLEAARALGDVLIVAVNTDSSVARIKGPGRPVTPETDRMRVLAALEAVTYVTSFEEDTAEEIVRTLHPDVYAKGGDYSADESSEHFPPEGHIVRGYGGRVQILPFVAGYSTTDVLEKLRDEPRES